MGNTQEQNRGEHFGVPVRSNSYKAPLVCFLNMTCEKQKRLTFGVYETDDGFTMTPAGKPYTVEYGNK